MSFHVTFLLVAAWLLSELLLAFRRRARGVRARREDRGTVLLLWAVISVSVTAAVLASLAGAGRLPLSSRAAAISGGALLLGGATLRAWSILTLGRFFTVDVAVHEGHRLVRSGPYRVLRHPSYTGLLASFAGLGLAFASWVSLLVLLVPITAAVARRIAVEEAALSTEFGEEHARWRATTWRLVPGVW